MLPEDTQRLTLELQRARDAQLAFAQRVVSGLDGLADSILLFEPAYELSGDFVDCLPLDATLFGLFIADVRGHGVPAAIDQALVRAIFHAVAPHHRSPAAALRDMNRLLHRELEPEAFATALYAVLDVERGRLTVARAGHEPLLLGRPGGGVERVDPEGMALAMDEGGVFDSVLQEREVQLEPGVMIAMYTDGITETKNAHDALFGVDRLTRLLDALDQPVALLAATVQAALDEHRGDGRQEDDVTLLLLRPALLGKRQS